MVDLIGYVNCNYKVKEQINIGNDTFVLAENVYTHTFVTWEYDEQSNSFYWGHYINDETKAKIDLLYRVKNSIEFKLSIYESSLIK